MKAAPTFSIDLDDDGVPGVTLKNGRVRLLASGVIETRVNDGASIDVDDLIEIKRANLVLCPDRHYAVLVASGNFTSITEDARKLSASEEYVQRTLGKALLVHNTATRLVAEFYLRVNKPKMPTRIFTDRIKALHWLEQIASHERRGMTAH